MVVEQFSTLQDWSTDNLLHMVQLTGTQPLHSFAVLATWRDWQHRCTIKSDRTNGRNSRSYRALQMYFYGDGSEAPIRYQHKIRRWEVITIVLGQKHNVQNEPSPTVLANRFASLHTFASVILIYVESRG